MGTGAFIAAGNLAMDQHTIPEGSSNTRSPPMLRESDKMRPDGSHGSYAGLLYSNMYYIQ